MSETEANKKNTSQPFSINSDAAWASMSTLLDEKMPVLPVEDEKKKKRRGFIFFPILAAASVIGFFLFTANKTTPGHSKDGNINLVKDEVIAAENKTHENVPQHGITTNEDLFHISHDSNSISVTNTTIDNDNVVAVAQNPEIAQSVYTTNPKAIKINTPDIGNEDSGSVSLMAIKNTNSQLLYHTGIDDALINSTLVSSKPVTANHNDFDTYAALLSNTEQELNIAELSKSTVVVSDSSGKTPAENTANKKETPQKKNQFEWIAGVGVERGLKNKDLGYYFTSKVLLPVSNKFSVSTGLVLLNGNGNVMSEDTYTKSFMTNTTDVKNVTKTTTFRNFNYISVPVQLVYKIKPQLYIGAGLQNSFLMKYKETESVELYDVNMNFLATYPTSVVDVGTIRMGLIEPATKVNKYDPRMLATIGYSYKNLRLEINYERGLKNAIRPIGYSEYRTSKTETLGLSLFYNIK